MSYTITIPWTLHAGDPARERDATVTVEYDYRKGRPAVMYLRNGDPGYPAEPAELTLLSVVETATGEDVWNAAGWERIWDRVWELHDPDEGGAA